MSQYTSYYYFVIRLGVMDEALVGAIERDLADVDEIRSAGTPTIIINGVLLGEIPDYAALVERIEGLLK